MIDEKFNFEKKENIINIDEVKRILDERADVEIIPNFLFIVKQIKENANLAIDSEDKDEIKKYLENIKRSHNYLGEKYRDTKEQRSYIEAVKKIMSFLEDKVRPVKKAY